MIMDILCSHLPTVLVHQALFDAISRKIYRKQTFWLSVSSWLNISSCIEQFPCDLLWMHCVCCTKFIMHNALMIVSYLLAGSNSLHRSSGGLQSFVMLRDYKWPCSESAVLTQQCHSHSSCFLSSQTRVWADESPCLSRLRWLCYDLHLHDFLFFCFEIHDALDHLAFLKAVCFRQIRAGSELFFHFEVAPRHKNVTIWEQEECKILPPLTEQIIIPTLSVLTVSVLIIILQMANKWFWYFHSIFLHLRDCQYILAKGWMQRGSHRQHFNSSIIQQTTCLNRRRILTYWSAEVKPLFFCPGWRLLIFWKRPFTVILFVVKWWWWCTLCTSPDENWWLHTVCVCVCVCVYVISCCFISRKSFSK